MMEMVTIRTLISMNAFRSLPEQGSITIKGLSALIGAEEGLISKCPIQLGRKLDLNNC